MTEVAGRVVVERTVEPEDDLVEVARRRLPLVDDALAAVADVLGRLSGESAVTSTD